MSTEKWYPGKYLASRRRSTRSGSGGDNPKINNNNNGGLVLDDDDLVVDDYEDITEPSPSSKIVNKEDDNLANLYLNIPFIGRITVAIRELRRLTMTKPRLVIAVENVSETIENPDIKTDRPFVFAADFREITSDLVIYFYDDYQVRSEPVGRVIIPFAHFFGSSAKPLKSKWEWRQIYPTYTYSGAANSKYRVGLEDIRDSVMIRPAAPLGFVNLKCEFNLSDSLFKLYLADGLVRYNKRYFKDRSIEPKQNYNVLAAKVRRDYSRVRKVLQPPAIISAFLYFPEVFILIALFYFLCRSVSGFLVPLSVIGVVFVNGCIANNQRDFNDVIIWNTPDSNNNNSSNNSNNNSNNNNADDDTTNNSSTATTTSGSTTTTTTMNPQRPSEAFDSLPESLKVLLINLSQHLSKFAVTLEKISNLFNFADSQVSNIGFTVLFSISIVSSIIILIFNWSRFIFVLGSLVFVYLAIRESFSDSMSGVMEHSHEMAESPPEDHANHAHGKIGRIRSAVFRLLRQVENLWYRIPDDSELVHRYVTSLTLVKEDGPEMSQSNWS